ncbi:hypothetical protein M9H77_13675 [Catharanthus roseus]|uniref:Uncharacterized protein n=1 Tax=Catharanthus roseus TaxID=4058 RepID=A0ACC0BL23_CATRO|nr:hypothetical protein M9H77_13675 [Catharanthus roseus]
MFCSYNCEMDALCLQCRSNGNIIEMYESMARQNLIITELSDRMCRNTLPKPELSHNPVRHVRFDAVKVCNESMPRRYPAVPNLPRPKFMFILITQHVILLDVEPASLSSRSNRSDQHPAISFSSTRDACPRFLYRYASVAAPYANFPADLTSFTNGQSLEGTMLLLLSLNSEQPSKYCI